MPEITHLNIDDDLPLNKPIKFATMAIIIKCVFQEGVKLYSKFYLDELFVNTLFPLW